MLNIASKNSFDGQDESTLTHPVVALPDIYYKHFQC
jgi:hypothetical protein